MAWTTADRDALKAAIAKSERRVRFSDREVEYRSTTEQLQALQAIEAELDATAATPRPKQYLGYGRKGF